ncbi:MAG: hypothetical protein GX237_10055 [Clostridiales bacterium]|nr:hypothetical protein [Clostridiales bacterium]
MQKEMINDVVRQYYIEVKRQFGSSLKAVVLFGSCARGDYDNESDIDLLVLLDLDTEELSNARKLMRPIADKLDLQYDVVISIVFQNYKIFDEYKEASGFYQNIEREGIVIE